MSAGYVIDTQGAIALVAGTAKTLLNFISVANGTFKVVEWSISFDGVTATAVPVLVEIGHSTQATAGTSSAAAITQIRGAPRTVEGTARRAYTVEPTVLTLFKPIFVRADGGLVIVQYPLGREPEQNTTADGFVIRATAPAIVNARAHMEIEEG